AAVISQLIFYTITGAFISVFITLVADQFLAANVVLAYVMFMVGTAALLDHNAAITSPDDFHILGFRPVTSRTYFAARIANVLVYVTVMTTLFAYLPIGAFFLRGGALVGLAAMAAIYGAAIFTAFSMVAVYSWLVTIVGAARIKRALSYVQMVFSFFVYGGYFVMSRMLSRQVLATMVMPKSVWVLMVPPTWFASYVDLAAGHHSASEIVPAAVSVIGIAALSAFIGGRLSLDYADRLGALASATAPKPAAPVRTRKAIWFTSGESRAIAMLIRSQFANDMKFRMSVLAILPLTIIYLAMGISRTGSVPDPFGGGEPGRGLGMVTLAMMMFPAMLKASLGRSDAFRASWIFFASPSDRARLILAAKNVLVVTFLLPYVACVAVVLSFFTSNVPHLLVHLAFIGLVSHFVLLVITLADPELPFSKPAARNRTSTRVFILVACVSFGAMFFQLLEPLLYRNVIAIALSFANLIAASVLVDRLIRMRIQAQTANLEFDG